MFLGLIVYLLSDEGVFSRGIAIGTIYVKDETCKVFVTGHR